MPDAVSVPIAGGAALAGRRFFFVVTPAAIAAAAAFASASRAPLGVSGRTSMSMNTSFFTIVSPCISG